MLLKASLAPAFSDQIFQIRVFISMRFRYILAIYQYIVDIYKFTKQFPAPLF